jgi:hypothetical protein
MRLFNFVAGTRALAEQMNTELDQILAQQNNAVDDLTNQEARINEVEAVAGQNLTAHAQGTDHDTRYYTKQQMDGRMRGGDTVIYYEVFTIVAADNGDGTFTYKNSKNEEVVGTLTAEGYQVFTLEIGTYVMGENRVSCIINDALHRSAASGGLVEVSATEVALTQPEADGMEITFQYFHRIGLMGEHAMSHQEGGQDMITVTAGMLAPELSESLGANARTANTPFKVEVLTEDPVAPDVGRLWLISEGV